MTSVPVKSRHDPFVDKVKTKIWLEHGAEDKPYVSDYAFAHGYSLIELIKKGYTHTDILFLLMRGELPSADQRALFDALSIGISNPGPRHPATRAVMEAAVSKTNSPHLLPIGLMVLGGDHAAGSVESVMRYLRLNKKKRPEALLEQYLAEYTNHHDDAEICPGFGPYFETRSEFYKNIADAIRSTFVEMSLPFLDWAIEMDKQLMDTSMALKANALAASIFLDLGFHPRTGPILFQHLSSPGLIAHAVEMMNQPVSAMPFVADDQYHHVEE